MIHQIAITALLVGGLLAPPFGPCALRSSVALQQAKPQPMIPDTPAGRQLAGFLDAFNTGDTNTIRSFTAEHFAKTGTSGPPGGQALRFLYQDTGGLSFYRAEKSTEFEIIAFAQERLTRDWQRVRIKVTPEPPYNVANWGIRYSLPPPDVVPRAKLDDAKLVKEIEADLQRRVAADLFSGTVLIAKNGKPIFEKAYGLADQNGQVPNQINTQFLLASATKMFTAVAIAQLAEKRKLSFSDKIIRYLPDYSNKTVAEKVTIHQLLTHTSGMGDYFNEKYKPASIKTLRDFLPAFVDDPLSFEPGTKYDYSNAGFIVLGLIVEQVSGQSYFDYVRDHIFKPAGMKNSDFYERGNFPSTVAIGYTQFEPGPNGRRFPKPRKDSGIISQGKSHLGSGGGAFSTIEDMLKFSVALRRHRLLNPKYTELVTKGKVETDEMGLAGSVKYGYGFFDEIFNGQRMLGHGGDFSGINTRFQMYLDPDYTVVILSNYDHPAAQRINAKIQEMITRK
jgi:CubicO group peptidase (beta-lactamase class C family)